jgi:hypothetical protein
MAFKNHIVFIQKFTLNMYRSITLLIMIMRNASWSFVNLLNVFLEVLPH